MVLVSQLPFGMRASPASLIPGFCVQVCGRPIGLDGAEHFVAWRRAKGPTANISGGVAHSVLILAPLSVS
jgi:hypothetical protein